MPAEIPRGCGFCTVRVCLNGRNSPIYTVQCTFVDDVYLCVWLGVGAVTRSDGWTSRSRTLLGFIPI